MGTELEQPWRSNLESEQEGRRTRRLRASMKSRADAANHASTAPIALSPSLALLFVSSYLSSLLSVTWFLLRVGREWESVSSSSLMESLCLMGTERQTEIE